MRLDNVSHQHSLKHKLLLRIMRLTTGYAPDVVKTLVHRPKYFGNHFSAWMQEIMRGEAPWPVGERELFAAFTSRINRCSY